MQKKFLISIDTEGDNLWTWFPGKEITTRNALDLPRFQSICDKYGFKPTYLTNYEMCNDSFYVDTFSKFQQENKCEIGMHLHAWNSPPDKYTLSPRTDEKSGQSYLIEYPPEVIEEKIAYMTDLISSRFGKRPVTHRAGRWAMNDLYFDFLDKYSYLADCSVTPKVDWSNHPGFSKNSGGSNYTNFPINPYIVPQTNILEIPMSIRNRRRRFKPNNLHLRSLISSLYDTFNTVDTVWLRPNGYNFGDMVWLADRIRHSNSDYLMFMIHSSELSETCNPRFNSKEKIDKLYSDINNLFSHISRYYIGMTIGDYASLYKQKQL